MVTRTTKNTFPKKETKKRSNFFEDKNETFTYLQGLKYIYLYDENDLKIQILNDTNCILNVDS